MIVSNPAGVAGVGIDVQERLLWRIELPEVVVSPTLNQAIRPKPACVVVAERDFCEWTRRRLERTGAVNFTSTVQCTNVVRVDSQLTQGFAERDERLLPIESPACDLALRI